MSKWESDFDREGLRRIVEDKMREIAVSAKADGEEDSFTATSAEYPFAAILVAGLIGCCDADAIAEGLGYEPEFTRQVVSRLEAAHLFQGGEFAGKDELSGDEAGIAFNLMVLVAQGDMARNASGGYAMTPSGNSRVERMLRK